MANSGEISLLTYVKICGTEKKVFSIKYVREIINPWRKLKILIIDWKYKE